MTFKFDMRPLAKASWSVALCLSPEILPPPPFWLNFHMAVKCSIYRGLSHWLHLPAIVYPSEGGEYIWCAPNETAEGESRFLGGVSVTNTARNGEAWVSSTLFVQSLWGWFGWSCRYTMTGFWMEVSYFSWYRLVQLYTQTHVKPNYHCGLI